MPHQVITLTAPPSSMRAQPLAMVPASGIGRMSAARPLLVKSVRWDKMFLSGIGSILAITLKCRITSQFTTMLLLRTMYSVAQHGFHQCLQRSAVNRKAEYQDTGQQGATLGANCTVVCGATIGRTCFYCRGRSDRKMFLTTP